MGRKRKHDPYPILEYIVKYKMENDGNTPGMRRIMEACGITSTGVMRSILDHLQELDAIRFIESYQGKQKRQQIVVVGGKWEFNGERA